MSPLSHVDDYPEIPVSGASTRTALKTGTWRSVRPVIAPRRAPCAAACPAGIGIPAFFDALQAGRPEAALAVVTTHNPFPRITGRVCPHRCEAACNLAACTGDEPVSIRAIERWLGDATAYVPHERPERATGRRVAVVGAGPAGLAAAFYLRRSGHDVTVIDRRDRPGGMLRYGIPEYRLPKAVVDAEVARLEATGITFRTGVALGSDVTLDELVASHAAVFVATGAWRSRPVGITGEHLLRPGLAFLEAVNGGEAPQPGTQCAVIGAGNTAMDVARVLRKLGAEVTVLYRRTADEMPAIREEYQRAVADGVVFRWLTLPVEVVADDAGLVVTVEEVRLGAPDHSGRPRPEPTGVISQLFFDTVYGAIGEVADVAPFPDSLRRRDGWLDVARDGGTADPAIFAGGDLVTGPGSVVDAIAAGRQAARAIDRRLGSGYLWPDEAPDDVVDPAEINPAYLPRHARSAPAAAEPADAFAEEAVTIDRVQASREIERCPSCGHCNRCRTCFVFCPDGAITWDGGPVIDHDFCKGCGICVVECPGHVLLLVAEREPSHA